MDIFDFAMKMELQGKAVYENIAATTPVPGIRTIFNGLAADEQKHYEVFRNLKEGKEWVMTESQMLDRAKTVFSELTSDKNLIRDLHDDLEGYRIGLKMEADSVKLYEDMAKEESDPEKVQLFLKLATEEKKHFNIIENVCDFLTRPKYYLAWREFSNLHEL